MNNRVIKFRAWDKVDTEIIEWEELRKIHCPLSYINECEKTDSRVLMQFTGLLDKNGKEIYEGDIVKIHNYKTTWKHGEPEIDWRVFEVQWNQTTYAFNNSVIYTPLSRYDTKDLMEYDIEIIGNIYENPELITNLT